ncbi:sensor histidine kinase [Tahibacter harae]|uniref:Histidine kinase n=1 Tax=Tahibacter harae TaxID=2963937 RepID=A0ABT1QWJ3_9GAMM|nr:histidine kinase [Tahibacter harae]
MENAGKFALDLPLPADVVVAGNPLWSRYRRYPVFSRAWLTGRTRVFAIVIAAIALLVGGGNGLQYGDYALGLLGSVYLFASLMAMTGTGPALATWVRHRGWAAQRERRGVVVAIVVGMALSAGVDAWASNRLEDLFEVSVRYGQAPPPVPPGALENALALTLNAIVLLIVYGMLGGALALRGYFDEQRRLQASLQRQELAALRLSERETGQRLALLQAQVEPHFLFNSLASIRALVAASPARAEAALDALVAYLRSTIPQLRDGQAVAASTLGQQLDICAAYLELMQARMGERLSFAIAATAELRALPFPPLLLIGLVENAIKHGVEPQSGPGHVRVEASRQDGELRVRVSDDGLGLRAGLGAGLGLANLREQLRLRYGGRAAFSLAGGRERGAVAEIRLPLALPA